MKQRLVNLSACQNLKFSIVGMSRKLERMLLPTFESEFMLNKGLEVVTMSLVLNDVLTIFHF